MENSIITQIEQGKEYILINAEHEGSFKALVKFMSDRGYKYIKSSVKTTVKLFKAVAL